MIKMSRVLSAAQADYAKNSYQATIASMALEAQRLNQAGDMIIIDPARHYVILAGANQDINTSINIDLINRVAYNLTVAPPPSPEGSSPEGSLGEPRPPLGAESDQASLRLLRIEQRLAALEGAEP
jgi:hypothetical protein